MSELSEISKICSVVRVLTIRSATSRQADMASLLNHHGLGFEFLYGTDLRKKTIQELISDGVYDPTPKIQSANPQLTASEVGCAVTHRMIAQRICEERLEAAVILEDDVSVVANNLPHLRDATFNLPDDWDLLYLGYNKNNIQMPLLTRIKLHTYYPVRYLLGSDRHNPSTIQTIFRRPFNQSWCKAGCFNGAHAYVLRPAAARYLVDLQTPVKYEADVALKHLVRFGELKAYCLLYDVFDQRWDVPSLIGDRPTWHD